MEKKRLFIATSKDLFTWDKLDGFGPIGVGNMRDPCIIKLDNGSYLLNSADFSYEGIPFVQLHRSEDLLIYEALETTRALSRRIGF